MTRLRALFVRLWLCRKHDHHVGRIGVAAGTPVYGCTIPGCHWLTPFPWWGAKP